MGNSSVSKMRETIINAEYVDFLLGLMKEYTGRTDIPEILYYEVLYTKKYLSKKDIMVEAQNLMGVWLECTDITKLTQDKISGLEKKQLSSRKMKLEEYRIGGVPYYFTKNAPKLVLMLVLSLLFIVPKDMIFKDNEILGTVFTLAVLPLFLFLNISIVIDLAYILIPATRLSEDCEKLVTDKAMDACKEHLEYMNAISVKDRARYISTLKEYANSLSEFNQKTAEYYNRVAEIELEIHDKELNNNEN